MASKLPSYSIAIRTLGTAGDTFRRELESISRQTVRPDKVMVYIAGQRPGFTVGEEEYVTVEKGMVSQRARRYDDIDSDVILFLDDDVELAPDSAEKLLHAMVDNGADAVGADTFLNHKMALWLKVYLILTNLVAPHWSSKWAFKIHSHGSFSYNNNPRKAFYWSQKLDGPAFMVRKKVWTDLRMADEKWLDKLGFAYGDDMLESYKLHVNGYKVGVLYNAGAKHLDAGTSSNDYRNSPQRLYVRTKAQYMIWRRAVLAPRRSARARAVAVTAFSFKMLWLAFVVFITSIATMRLALVGQFVRGLRDGRKRFSTGEMANLHPYVVA